MQSYPLRVYVDTRRVLRHRQALDERCKIYGAWWHQEGTAVMHMRRYVHMTVEAESMVEAVSVCLRRLDDWAAGLRVIDVELDELGGSTPVEGALDKIEHLDYCSLEPDRLPVDAGGWPSILRDMSPSDPEDPVRPTGSTMLDWLKSSGLDDLMAQSTRPKPTLMPKPFTKLRGERTRASIYDEMATYQKHLDEIRREGEERRRLHESEERQRLHEVLNIAQSPSIEMTQYLEEVLETAKKLPKRATYRGGAS